MMYNERFVCAIKVGGKILREDGNLVTLPFGAEYSILLKNLESRRSLVSVSVDGQNATDGTIIVNANQSIDLGRYIRDNNLERGNRFKFIERTAAIEAHRGIKADDGLVRVEYQFEVRPAIEEIIRKRVIVEEEYDPWPRPYPRPWPKYPRNPWSLRWDSSTCGPRPMHSPQGSLGRGSMRPSAGSAGSRSVRASASSRLPQRKSGPSRQNVELERGGAGITVAGSESNQRFVMVSGFPVEAVRHVIVLQLRGQIGEVQVAAPVTVDVKPQCSTCGKVNKGTNKFCAQCGTALQLI
jgi:hypothetical protein